MALRASSPFDVPRDRGQYRVGAVDGEEADALRTREVVAWLGKIGDTGRTMVVAPEASEGIGRAMANLPDVALRTPSSLRLSDVMESDTLLVTRPALEALAVRAGERAEARA